MYRRIARTTIICIAIAASLLSFPNVIPWMLGAWLLAYAWRLHHGKPAWPALAIAVAVVLVKRIDWPPGLLGLAAVFLAAGLLEIAWRRHDARPRPIRQRAAVISALVLAWAMMAYDWHQASHANRRVDFDPHRPIVCLGDSLTSGLPPAGGYPVVLGQLLSVPVVDLGQPGISSAEGLKSLPRGLATNPQAVVIELGGHDFLKGFDRAVTKQTLEQIITDIRGAGAEPVLMEIPRGFIVDPYAGLDRELAREQDLELISDSCVRKLVLFSPYCPPGMWIGGPYLSDDGIHPTTDGNRVLADGVLAGLLRLYGSQIKRP